MSENKNIREELLDLMSLPNYQPVDVDGLYNLLGLKTPDEFTSLAKCLNDLEEEFIIIHNKKGCFAKLETFGLAQGILDVKEGGYGFVDTDNGGIFIKEGNLNGAITYDHVLIKISLDNINRLEGKVERIIKRGSYYFYGKLRFYRKKYFVESIDQRIKLVIYIKQDSIKSAHINDVVEVKVNKYFDNGTASGEIIKIIGDINEPGIDIDAMILSSGIKEEFSDETIEEIKKIPDEINPNDYPNRRIINETVITIDGSDAKDLDDAISVKKLPNGNYSLGVYIADVANYVKEGTFLDIDAFTRGTSVYLPDRVIPMLPKKLSNGICSLNEGVYRLVMACEMEINLEGKVINQEIFEGIIKSNHRMTYDMVNLILNNDQNAIDQYSDLVAFLNDANALSKILSAMRKKRGAFFFEYPEAKLQLEDGKVKDIILRKRDQAEIMIEEFMLICNETVANMMTWLDVPFLYRVHEEPNAEKVTRFLDLLNGFGYNYKVKNKNNIAKFLQNILEEFDVDESDISKEEQTKRLLINHAMIRSMAKAKYQPVNIGHFGLASKCYCHFTSPIRRYPDLLVHRLIKNYLIGTKQTKAENDLLYFNKKVLDAGYTSSLMERKAETLERDAVNYKECEYMRTFIGETFSGTISSITNFGVFITLDNTIEGLAKFNEMHDDYYEVNEKIGRIYGVRTKKTYRIGDRVVIRVMDSNPGLRKITFRLLKKE